MKYDGQTTSPAPTVSRRLRILLAEDDPANSCIAQDVLARMKCVVTVVETGSAALEAAMRHEFDVLLMDVRMPLMDGLEAVRRIAAFERTHGRRHAPVVAITAGAMPTEIQQCIDAGVDDVLTKPYRIDALEDKVLSWSADPALLAAASVIDAITKHRKENP